MIKAFLVIAFLTVYVSANAIKSSKIGNVECSLCQQAIKLIENQLENNATINSIVTSVEVVCTTYLAPDYVSKCEAFLEKYMPQVISLVLQKITPAEVCSLVQLCPK